MANQNLMKDGLNDAAIVRIAAAFSQAHKAFASRAFCKACLDGLEERELRQRVDHVIEQLVHFLPDSFVQTAPLLQVLPEYWDHGDPDDPIRGFAAWPVIDYVAVAGIDSPELALNCLEKLTSLFSAEFSIRAFIEVHPDITFVFLNRWLTHPDEHVRRLVSEGTRPLLPWGKRLTAFVDDPTPLLPLLDALKNDVSLYVRRSVANNVNDISKHHPEYVIECCLRWQKEYAESKDKAHIDWVIKHATRTLVKKGHPSSFTLLGYTDKPKVEVTHFSLNKKTISFGQNIVFDLTVYSKKNAQKCVIDFAVHYQKANGSLSAKVFKLKNITINKNESMTFQKAISFKPITTRKYYPGEHGITIHINGEEKSKERFTLKS